MNNYLTKTGFLMLMIALLASCGTKKNADETEASNEEVPEEKLGSDADISEGLNVFFRNLKDGDTIASPFKVEMGVNGMEIEPAGELAKNKGHHHILINHPANEKGVVVATDSTHIHFGKGETETDLDLTPGDYMITLQFADGFHRSYGEKMSKSIQITVVEKEK